MIEQTVNALRDHEVAIPLLEAAERALTRLNWPSTTDDYLSRMAPSPQMQVIWELPAGLNPHPSGLNDEQRATVEAAADELEQALLALQSRFLQHGRLVHSQSLKDATTRRIYARFTQLPSAWPEC